METVEPTPIPPPPPAAPRPLSPRVRRGAWFEPHVRFWWLLTLATGIGVIALLVQAMIDQHADDRLFLHGTHVSALVLGGVKGQKVAPDTPIDLAFTLNGTSYTVNGLLEGRTDYVERGSTVPLLVDPNDTQHWTYRTIGPPFASQLVAPGIAAGVCLIAGIIAAVEHARVLRTLRTGEAWLGRVIDVNTSALAPLARQVRVVAADAKQKQLQTVFVPGPFGRSLKDGDLLWLCSSGPRSGRTLPLV